jgi:phospholipase/carboxylesterase
MELELNSLPTRSRPRPPTNKNMPHSQIGIKPVPEVNAELFRRVYSLPNVSNRPTVISVPGARAIWLDPDLVLEHPEVIVRGREFGHIHPDGSLHVALPPERAREAVEKGWAEPHPVAQYLGIDGMVMLYTPLDMDELEVVFGLIMDSYNFVTGSALRSEDILTSIASVKK